VGRDPPYTYKKLMPNYLRAYVPGGTFFFTPVTYQRRPLFRQPAARHALREAIQHVRADRPFTIEAFVLMPDHLHMLWTLPPGDADFSTRVRLIKHFTTRALGRVGHASYSLGDRLYVGWVVTLPTRLVARVANAALKTAWCQKWLVHRRLRPEEFGGRVQQQKTGAALYPISSELLTSPVLAEVFARYGTYLLSMAYPEGCPPHPAYPAGHATIAGACATVLKAFFKETFEIPKPIEASADGLTLNPYVGPALTVGGELNKLASNISLGRDAAGVHWRSDGIEGMNLGEAVAINILLDESVTYNEDFAGFSLTKFDETTVTV